MLTQRAGSAVTAFSLLVTLAACAEGGSAVAPSVPMNETYRLTGDGNAKTAARIWASSFANDPSGDGFVNYYKLRGKNQ